MKHSKRLIKIMALFIIVWIPIATAIDTALYYDTDTRGLVTYETPKDPHLAFLLRNLIETGIFCMGMTLGYLLYRKDIYRWFK